jgi:hypothetical protein
MKTPWQEFKEKMGDARPWHLLDKNNYVEESVSDERFSHCLSCPELINSTKQCKQCGCIMTMKVKLKQASCPVGKW